MDWLRIINIAGLSCNILGAWQLATNLDTEWGKWWLVIGFTVQLIANLPAVVRRRRFG